MTSPTPPSDAAFGYLSIGYKTAFASEHLQQQQSSVSDEGEEDEVTDLAQDFLQLTQSRHQAETRRSCELHAQEQQQQQEQPSYLAQQGQASCLLHVEPLKQASEDGQRGFPITTVTSDSTLRHCVMTHNSEELLKIQQQQQQHQEGMRDFNSEEDEELPDVTHSTDDDSSSVPGNNDKAAAAAASRVEDPYSSKATTTSDQKRRLPSVRFSQPPTAVFAIESQPPELDSALVSEAAPPPTTSASQQEVTVTLQQEAATAAHLRSFGADKRQSGKSAAVEGQPVGSVTTSLPVQEASESSSTDATFFEEARRLVTPSSSEASEELDQCQMKSLQEFVNTSVMASAKSSPAKWADQGAKWSADRADKLAAAKSILKQPTQSGKTVDSGVAELPMVTAQNCQPVKSAGEEAAVMTSDVANEPPPGGQRRASSVKFADKRHVKEVSTSALDQPVKRSAKRAAAKAASKKFAKLARRSAKPASRPPVKTAAGGAAKARAPARQLLMEKAGTLRVRQTSKSLGEADVVLLARRRSSLGSKKAGAAAAGKAVAEEAAAAPATEAMYMYDEDSDPYVSDVTSRSSLTSYLMQLLRLGDFSNAKEFGTITKDAKSRLAFIALISPEVREMFDFHAATVGKIARLTGCRVRLKRAILNRKTNGSGTWARFAQIEIEGIRPLSASVCDRLLRERFRCYEDRRPLRQQDSKASVVPLCASWDAPDDRALAFASQRTRPKSAASPAGPGQEGSASLDDQYRLIAADYGPVADEDTAFCDN